MIHLITYANNRCSAGKARLLGEAHAVGWFDTITGYGPENLDSDFINRFHNILNVERGGGYWIWKPWIIKKHLDKINNGDILIYLDAGCSINPNGKKRFDEYIQMLNESGVGCISFQTEHIEKKFTTKEIFEYFNVELDGKIANSGQIIGGVQIIKKTANSLRMVNLWNQAIYDNPLLITDYYNNNNQNSYFYDNRHDQSLFSVIRKMHNTILLTDEVYFQPFGNEESLKYPFWTTRSR